MQNFQTETEFNNYLKAISETDYLIVIAVRDTIGSHVGVEGYANLKKLGLKLLGSKEDGSFEDWKGYVAIINKGILLYEKLEELHMTVEYETIIDNVKLEIYSSPFLSTNRASILVDDKEYSVNRRGFNIVVIDTDIRKVIDSVGFDTWADGRPCYRNESLRKVVYNPSDYDRTIISSINECRKRLNPAYIIDDFNCYKKVKIRIFQWADSSIWSAMESVAVEFLGDVRYDLMVIIDEIGEDGIKLYKRITSLGIRAVMAREYSVEKDRPDITIFNNHIMFKFAEANSVKLKYLIPFILINGGEEKSNAESINTAKASNGVIKRIFVDRNMFDALSGLNLTDASIELSGNPKFDLIYNSIKSHHEIPDGWGKLKSKKVILWAFDHNWWMKSSSTDLYFKDMLKSITEDEQLGLIIRPHVIFVKELQSMRIWTVEETQTVKNFCEQSKNIVWDDNLDYGFAYSIADAIITDVNCGIIISALPLDKPIAVLQRYDGNICEPHYPDIVSSHYNINSVDELDTFFEMVKNSEDPKRRQRQIMFERYVAHFDGLNGRRIKEVIDGDAREMKLIH